MIGQNRMQSSQVFISSFYLVLITYAHSVTPSVIKPKTLEQWLESICLPQYTTNFSKGGLTSLDMLAYVNSDVLDDMGIKSVLHRQIILSKCK